jgi:hypothetical protein
VAFGQAGKPLLLGGSVGINELRDDREEGRRASVRSSGVLTVLWILAKESQADATNQADQKRQHDVARLSGRAGWNHGGSTSECWKSAGPVKWQFPLTSSSNRHRDLLASASRLRMLYSDFGHLVGFGLLLIKALSQQNFALANFLTSRFQDIEDFLFLSQWNHPLP